MMSYRCILGVFAVFNLACQAVAGDGLNVVFENTKAKDSPSDRTIELHNVTIAPADQKSCAEFDGKSALTISGDSDITFNKSDALWIELWLDPASKGKVVTLVAKGSGANYRLGIGANGTAFFSYYANAQWRTLLTEEPLELNTWQHLACYADPSLKIAMIFLNGKVIAKSSEQLQLHGKVEEPLYIGGSPDKNSGEFLGFKGRIGTIKIERDAPFHLLKEKSPGEQAFEVKPQF